MWIFLFTLLGAILVPAIVLFGAEATGGGWGWLEMFTFSPFVGGGVGLLCGLLKEIRSFQHQNETKISSFLHAVAVEIGLTALVFYYLKTKFWG